MSLMPGQAMRSVHATCSFQLPHRLTPQLALQSALGQRLALRIVVEALGTWSINIYRVECTSDWGGALLLTLLVCVIVYIGGGVGYNIKAKGVTPGLSALPHRELWINVAGLVVDGVVFTLARAKVVVAATGATKAGIGDGRLESQVPLVQDRNDGNSEDEEQQKETPEAEAEAK